LPDQTRATFRESVAELAGRVDHVSIYLLEADKSRALEEDLRARPERYLCDEEQADAWLEAGESLVAGGFEHYEISNWARPGREARHNVKYWTRTPTLGLGVSAHEFWSGRRRANVSGLPQYVARLQAGDRPLALDDAVTAEAAERERIVLGLRLAAGVAASEIEEWIEGSGDAFLESDYRVWLDEGILARQESRVRFTERGFLVSNEVLCRFV
jgi:oxygen-independent coproporphyrinogen-3 oxidase